MEALLRPQTMNHQLRVMVVTVNLDQDLAHQDLALVQEQVPVLVMKVVIARAIQAQESIRVCRSLAVPQP